MGNGSNDVLEIIARALVSDSDEVIYSEYAFAVYPIVTQAIGATAVVTPAKDWGHDLSAMLSAVTDKTKLIFFFFSMPYKVIHALLEYTTRYIKIINKLRVQYYEQFIDVYL